MHIKLRVFTGLFLGLIGLSGQAALADCGGGSIPGRLGCQAADAFNGAARKVDDINAGVAAQKAADALAQDRSRAAAKVLEQSIGKRNEEIARAAQEAVERRRQHQLPAHQPRNDYTRGQEVTQGTYSVGDQKSKITVRSSQGDIGSIQAVTGGAYGKSHTTAHPDGSFHHHGEHAKARNQPFSR